MTVNYVHVDPATEKIGAVGRAMTKGAAILMCSEPNVCLFVEELPDPATQYWDGATNAPADKQEIPVPPLAGPVPMMLDVSGFPDGCEIRVSNAGALDVWVTGKADPPEFHEAGTYTVEVIPATEHHLPALFTVEVT